MERRKVKNGEKSPWEQCLTRPVPNGRRRSGFRLVPENLCFFLRNLQLMTQQENCKRSAKKRDYSFAANNHQNGRIVKQQQQQIFLKIGNITNSHYFPTRK